jgi:hypothetical protein
LSQQALLHWLFHASPCQPVCAKLICSISLNQALYFNHQDLGVTYHPTNFSDQKESDDGSMVHISNGLTCKRMFMSGEKVKFANRKHSNECFHTMPDGAGAYMKKDRARFVLYQ